MSLTALVIGTLVVICACVALAAITPKRGLAKAAARAAAQGQAKTVSVKGDPSPFANPFIAICAVVVVLGLAGKIFG